jgi:hypothetical protein
MAEYNFSKPAISILKNTLMAEYNFSKPAISSNFAHKTVLTHDYSTIGRQSAGNFNPAGSL